jgi:hypothetical protein
MCLGVGVVRPRRAKDPGKYRLAELLWEPCVMCGGTGQVPKYRSAWEGTAIMEEVERADCDRAEALRKLAAKAERQRRCAQRLALTLFIVCLLSLVAGALWLGLWAPR